MECYPVLLYPARIQSPQQFMEARGFRCDHECLALWFEEHGSEVGLSIIVNRISFALRQLLRNESIILLHLMLSTHGLSALPIPLDEHGTSNPGKARSLHLFLSTLAMPYEQRRLRHPTCIPLATSSASETIR